MVISMMGAYLIITTKELTVLRQFIALEVRAKINLQIIAEVGKLNHCVVIYRNAILSALFFCKYFLLTMSINLLCTFCLWTLTKSFQIFGKMCPDIICISEDCGINGSKSMTDTCLVFKCTAFIRSNTHRKDGAENLAEHSITVTLMTSVYLFITTKWHDSAALLGNNIGTVSYTHLTLPTT